jgi:apolipoprotein N-acyltransferase
MLEWRLVLFSIMTWLNKWYIAWPLSGVLLGIGFVIPLLWIVGLAGGAYFLYLFQQTKSWRQKIFGAWLAWTIKAAFSVGWLLSSYPIEWLPIEFGQIQILLVSFTWLMTAVCLGSGAVIFVLVSEFLKRRTDLLSWSYYGLIYPLLWVISESLGSLALAAFFYGPGGSFDTSFGSGYVGYLLAGHEGLLQVARLAGVFSLTYLFVLLAGLLVWGSEQRKRLQYSGLALVAVVYLSGFVPILRLVTEMPTTGYTVLAIDTQIGSRILSTKAGKEEADAALTEAVKAALEEEADYILLPEDSRYFDQSHPINAIRSRFERQYNNPAVVLVDSGRVTLNGVTVQQAFVSNGPEDSIERFHKRYLVPQGEYFSTVYSWALQAAGFGESLEYLSQSMSYRVGPWTNQSSAAANVPGILFCFESFSPQGVRRLVEERTEMPFVAHIASHAWFHEPYTLWSQMESMLRVQAIWNQQYVVTAGNMVSGKVYTPTGAVEELTVVANGERWQVKQTIIPRQ